MVTYEDMSGRVAVVTGAASGIGRATACGFAENGAIAVFADIDYDGAKAAADEMTEKGFKAKAVMLDVRKYDVVESVVNEEGIICSRIDSIQAGYLQSVQVSGESLLVPVWRLETDAGVVLINAETGKLESGAA